MIPYTGSAKVNCYCDNEPQYGRGDQPVFPFGSQFMYCALIDDKLICDVIALESQTGSGQPDTAVVVAKGFELNRIAF